MSKCPTTLLPNKTTVTYNCSHISFLHKKRLLHFIGRTKLAFFLWQKTVLSKDTTVLSTIMGLHFFFFGKLMGLHSRNEICLRTHFFHIVLSSAMWCKYVLLLIFSGNSVYKLQVPRESLSLWGLVTGLQCNLTCNMTCCSFSVCLIKPKRL